MGKNTNDEKRTTVNELMSAVADKTAQAGKKGFELASTALAQTASGSKALAGKIAKSAEELSEKTKLDNYNKRMKRYNPLFEDEYRSGNFFVPNIICIVDDAVRRDVDVCQGAIGWREDKKGVEVLFLYDEFVDKCGLNFVPTALCDEIYYVDSFDKKRFIKLDYIFKQAHEEKMAELANVASCLGAKSCTIEIEESVVQHDKKKKNIGTSGSRGVISATESYEAEVSADSAQKRSGRVYAEFVGSGEITRPVLKWFAHDNNILNLIESRITGTNPVKTQDLELSGSSSSTMSRKAAGAVDLAVASMGINQSYAMEDKSVNESSMKIIYHLEF